MSLEVGTHIGPYEITGMLGAGGMGVVYRAHDVRLARDVALKVLPDAFAHDRERLARFEREAQVLASLKHPSIGAIYGLEESAGVRALVLELVEGDTLAERVAARAASGGTLRAEPGVPRDVGKVPPSEREGVRGGPAGLPVDEALLIARQVAEALEAAHEQGVIHRDLKPANIKVSPDGFVKVLDFGLAKLIERGSGTWDQGSARANGDDVATVSPTLSLAATGAGVILGTAAYMAPEQAKGRPADKRSDVWSFGCVLYEILTGRRAFDGDDVADTLASVLKGEPDWDAVPAEVPRSIRALLKGCLTKDRRQRVADMSAALFVMGHQAALEVREVSGLASALAKATVDREGGHFVRRPLWRRAVPYAAAVAVTAAVVAYAAWTLKPASASFVTRFSITLPEGEVFTRAQRRLVALSPDGSRLVYVANNRVNVRALDQLDAAPIRGTDGTVNTGPEGVFFSPDGQWIGYFADGQLKKISVSGGTPVVLCAVQNPVGASWGFDDTIVFAEPATGIWRVSANGGTPENIIKLNRGEGRFPEALPGGRAILFTVAQDGSEEHQVVVQRLDTGTRDVVISRGNDARYLPTGHLVYMLRGTLFAIPFDLNTLRVSGSPVSLVEDVAETAGTRGGAQFSVSRDGDLAYLTGYAGNILRALVWVDRQGREEPINAPPREYAYPRVSPNGTKIALDVREESNDIWIWDLARETLTRLTFDPGRNRSPVWSPDGQRVAFSAARNGSENVYWQSADGAGAAEALTQEQGATLPVSFSPDAKHLVFTLGTPPDDLAVVTVGGDRKASPILSTAFSERNGEVSPDGRWLAYQSNESGREEIYVRPFPDVASGRWQVSTVGGTRPLWARSGRELFYYVEPGTLMSVPVQSGSTFAAGTPQKLFAGSYLSPELLRTYDVSPDGRRFLMIKQAERSEHADARMIVVKNWVEELKRRVRVP